MPISPRTIVAQRLSGSFVFHVALTQVPLRALRGRIVDKPLRAREDGELILVVDDDLTPSNPDTMVGQIRQIPRQVFPRSTNM